MNKRGHSVGAGITAGLTIYFARKGFINSKEIIDNSLIILGIIPGAFIPDLDAEYSYIKSKLPILPGLIEFLQKALPENNITCHRGAMFHSLLTLIPCIIFWKIHFVLGLGLGILSHHILDMVTPAGLRWLWPYKVKIHLWRRVK